MIKVSFLVCVFSFCLLGCTQKDNKSPDSTNSSASDKSSLKNSQLTQDKTMQENMQTKSNLPYKGTVHYLRMEGGFYGIITDKGEKLLPLNLDKQYLSSGAIIHFSGSYVKDMMTIQQWGTPFKIKEVKLISAGDKSTNPRY